MVSNPLLTAIVPIQNLERDKGNLLSWFKDAGAVSIEVIFCYDSELVNAQEILEFSLLEIKDFNCKFISGDFKSPGMARNEGLKYRTGEWICFWDSDDKPDLISFANMVPMDPDIDVVVGSFLVVNETISVSKYNSVHPIEDLSGILSLMLNPGIWRFCFSANAIHGLKFQDFLMAEDQVFLTELLLRGPRIKTVESVVYSYRVGHLGRLTSNPGALQQLTDSMGYLRNLEGVRDHPQKRLINLVLVKQFVTYLKRTRPHYRWRHLTQNLAFFLKQPATTARNILFILKKGAIGDFKVRN